MIILFPIRFTPPLKMKPVVIPKAVQREFLARARANKDSTGRHVETLAFVMGYESEQGITATSLLFPVQTGNSARVTDEGRIAF